MLSLSSALRFVSGRNPHPRAAVHWERRTPLLDGTPVSRSPRLRRTLTGLRPPLARSLSGTREPRPLPRPVLGPSGRFRPVTAFRTPAGAGHRGPDHAGTRAAPAPASAPSAAGPSPSSARRGGRGAPGPFHFPAAPEGARRGPSALVLRGRRRPGPTRRLAPGAAASTPRPGPGLALRPWGAGGRAWTPRRPRVRGVGESWTPRESLGPRPGTREPRAEERKEKKKKPPSTPDQTYKRLSAPARVR